MVAVVACESERTFAVIERGAVAEVILFAYEVFHSVVEAVRGMVYPLVKEKTPVPVLYESPVAEEERDARARESR